MRAGVGAMLGAGGLVVAGAWHAGPAATKIEALRRRTLPAMAGMGRIDHVALTFDDGPDPASTPRFLEVLDGLGWTATFFALGTMVERAPGLLAEMAAAGHEIGLHGWSHRSLLKRTPSSTRDDLRRSFDLVAELTGVPPSWYRPPFGVLSGPAWAQARRLGMTTVLWSAWGRDWRAEASPGSVLADVSAGVLPGGCVLLHDSDCTSAPGAWRAALGALPLLADLFAGQGLDVGPLRDHDHRRRQLRAPVATTARR
jgi:peptidoglycan/xylan/chitin deacetylase (PgdA/CDA1 family)